MGRCRVFSSAGLEHHLDRVGVGGSNPPRLTGTKFVVLVFSYQRGLSLCCGSPHFDV